MTTLTLTIPDELVAQAKAVGVFDEVHILQAFNDFIERKQVEKPNQRELGRLRGSVTYMADDFDAPLDDFKDYM